MPRPLVGVVWCNEMRLPVKQYGCCPMLLSFGRSSVVRLLLLHLCYVTEDSAGNIDEVEFVFHFC